jgi:7-cyano-7-deazaguanine synthase in queuosine biosynthesis/ribosome-associated translation inhibitor RaiA
MKKRTIAFFHNCRKVFATTKRQVISSSQRTYAGLRRLIQASRQKLQGNYVVMRKRTIAFFHNCRKVFATTKRQVISSSQRTYAGLRRLIQASRQKLQGNYVVMRKRTIAFFHNCRKVFATTKQQVISSSQRTYAGLRRLIQASRQKLQGNYVVMRKRTIAFFHNCRKVFATTKRQIISSSQRTYAELRGLIHASRQRLQSIYVAMRKQSIVFLRNCRKVFATTKRQIISSSQRTYAELRGLIHASRQRLQSIYVAMRKQTIAFFHDCRKVFATTKQQVISSGQRAYAELRRLIHASRQRLQSIYVAMRKQTIAFFHDCRKVFATTKRQIISSSQRTYAELRGLIHASRQRLQSIYVVMRKRTIAFSHNCQKVFATTKQRIISSSQRAYTGLRGLIHASWQKLQSLYVAMRKRTISFFHNCRKVFAATKRQIISSGQRTYVELRGLIHTSRQRLQSIYVAMRNQIIGFSRNCQKVFTATNQQIISSGQRAYAGLRGLIHAMGNRIIAFSRNCRKVFATTKRQIIFSGQRTYAELRGLIHASRQKLQSLYVVMRKRIIAFFYNCRKVFAATKRQIISSGQRTYVELRGLIHASRQRLQSIYVAMRKRTIAFSHNCQKVFAVTKQQVISSSQRAYTGLGGLIHASRQELQSIYVAMGTQIIAFSRNCQKVSAATKQQVISSGQRTHVSLRAMIIASWQRLQNNYIAMGNRIIAFSRNCRKVFATTKRQIIFSGQRTYAELRGLIHASWQQLQSIYVAMKKQIIVFSCNCRKVFATTKRQIISSGQRIYANLRAMIIASWQGVQSIYVAMRKRIKAFSRNCRKVSAAIKRQIISSGQRTHVSLRAMIIASWQGLEGIYVAMRKRIKAFSRNCRKVFATTKRQIISSGQRTHVSLRAMIIASWQGLEGIYVAMRKRIKAFSRTCRKVSAAIKQQVISSGQRTHVSLRTMIIASWQRLQSIYVAMRKRIKAFSRTCRKVSAAIKQQVISSGQRTHVSLRTMIIASWQRLQSIYVAMRKWIKAFSRTCRKVSAAIKQQVISSGQRTHVSLRTMIIASWQRLQSIYVAMRKRIKAFSRTCRKVSAAIKQQVISSGQRTHVSLRAMIIASWQGLEGIYVAMRKRIKAFSRNCRKVSAAIKQQVISSGQRTYASLRGPILGSRHKLQSVIVEARKFIITFSGYLAFQCRRVPAATQRLIRQCDSAARLIIRLWKELVTRTQRMFYAAGRQCNLSWKKLVRQSYQTLVHLRRLIIALWEKLIGWCNRTVTAMIYRTSLKSGLLGCVKTPGLNDRKASCIAAILRALRSFNRGSFHVSLKGYFSMTCGIRRITAFWLKMREIYSAVSRFIRASWQKIPNVFVVSKNGSTINPVNDFRHRLVEESNRELIAAQKIQKGSVASRRLAIISLNRFARQCRKALIVEVVAKLRVRRFSGLFWPFFCLF